MRVLCFCGEDFEADSTIATCPNPLCARVATWGKPKPDDVGEWLEAAIPRGFAHDAA